LTNICWRDNGKGGWDVDELRYLQLELTWRALGGKDGVVIVLTIVLSEMGMFVNVGNGRRF